MTYEVFIERHDRKSLEKIPQSQYPKVKRAIRNLDLVFPLKNYWKQLRSATSQKRWGTWKTSASTDPCLLNTDYFFRQPAGMAR